MNYEIPRCKSYIVHGMSMNIAIVKDAQDDVAWIISTVCCCCDPTAYLHLSICLLFQFPSIWPKDEVLIEKRQR